MNTTELKPLLQQALQMLCKFKAYYEGAFPKAQNIGLQGEKRVFRLESVEHHNLCNYFISDSFDSFGMILEKQDQAISAIDATDIPSFFKKYLTVLEKEYTDLHNMANSLVVACIRDYADVLYEKCSCLLKHIRYYRRTILEGDLCKWDSAYIALLMDHQITRENRHDEYEKKECEAGYKY